MVVSGPRLATPCTPPKTKLGSAKLPLKSKRCRPLPHIFGIKITLAVYDSFNKSGNAFNSFAIACLRDTTVGPHHAPPPLPGPPITGYPGCMLGKGQFDLQPDLPVQTLPQVRPAFKWRSTPAEQASPLLDLTSSSRGECCTEVCKAGGWGRRG